MKTYEVYFQGVVLASESVTAGSITEALFLLLPKFQDKEYLATKLPGWTGEMGTVVTVKGLDEEETIDLIKYIKEAGNGHS